MRKFFAIFMIFSMLNISACSTLPQPSQKQIMKGVVLGALTGAALSGIVGADSVAQFAGIGAAGGVAYQYAEPKLRTMDFSLPSLTNFDSQVARDMGIKYEYPNRDPKMDNSPRRQKNLVGAKYVVAAKPLYGTANKLFTHQNVNPYYQNQRYYRPQVNVQKPTPRIQNQNLYSYQKAYTQRQYANGNSVYRNGFASSNNARVSARPQYYYNPQTGQYYYYVPAR